MSAEPLNERKFSLPEVCALMLLEMHNLNTSAARQSWTECGGPGEVFDRIITRLTEAGALVTHPRRRDCAQTGKLYEALGDHYTNLMLLAALAEEAHK